MVTNAVQQVKMIICSVVLVGTECWECDYMPNLNQSFQWAVNTCNAPNIGYSQPYRNQRTVGGVTYYDCSSFLWYALLAGGFDVTGAYRQAVGYDYSGNAIVTATEQPWLQALGFQQIPKNSEWKPGDICWRSGHTEMVHTGGIGQGITMGAHSSNYPLDRQVSINTTVSSNWSTVWRYGDGATGGYGLSIHVASAMCGNFWQESNINPGLWEGRREGTWDELKHGFGLGQWTNTGGDTRGRLWKLHEYLTQNNFSDDSGEGQLKYLIVENTWYPAQEASAYASLSDYLNSTSADLAHLTHAYNIGWEGIHDASWDLRVEHSHTCFSFIQSHANDTSINSWVTGNRYLSQAEILNNAVMVYRTLSAGGGGGGTVTPAKHHMPVWMMLHY